MYPTCIANQGAKKLGDEDDEDTSATVQGERDAYQGNDATNLKMIQVRPSHLV